MVKTWGWLFLLSMLFLTGCDLISDMIASEKIKGSGDVIEKGYEIGDFDELTFSAIGALQIKYGEKETLRVEAEDNIIDYFEVDVNGDDLEISVQSGIAFLPTKPIRWVLTITDLDKLTLSGAGDIDAPALTAERIDLIIDGAGRMSVESVNATHLEVAITGAGGVTIAGGEVETQNIGITGAGSYKAKGMVSDSAEIAVSGAGSATINAQNSLKAVITGVGSVKYVGNPVVDEQVTGAGGVEKIEE